jgi:large subunit ribosomal protein L10
VAYLRPFFNIFMITRADKEKIVADLADCFKRQKVTVFADFHGMSVAKAQALRRSLKKDDAEFRVSRKTLLDRALQVAGLSFKTKELEGEIGVAIGYGDEVAPGKTVFGVTKEIKTFKILGGILGTRILDETAMVALANLPSREILLTQLACVVQSPLRGLVIVLSGNMRNFVTVLSKIRDNKEL